MSQDYEKIVLQEEVSTNVEKEEHLGRVNVKGLEARERLQWARTCNWKERGCGQNGEFLHN